MAKQRWFVGQVSAEELARPGMRRKYTWQTTLLWSKPNLGAQDVRRIALERNAPLHLGGKLIWYPVWPRNVDGKPRRRGAGSVQETGI